MTKIFVNRNKNGEGQHRPPDIGTHAGGMAWSGSHCGYYEIRNLLDKEDFMSLREKLRTAVFREEAGDPP